MVASARLSVTLPTSTGIGWSRTPTSMIDRIDPYWIDFERILVPHLRKWKWRMWAEHGVEFFIHPAMEAAEGIGFPDFFRSDRRGRPRGVIRIVRAKGK